jgi:hypothetical protein
MKSRAKNPVQGEDKDDGQADYDNDKHLEHQETEQFLLRSKLESRLAECYFIGV